MERLVIIIFIIVCVVTSVFIFIAETYKNNKPCREYIGYDLKNVPDRCVGFILSKPDKVQEDFEK